MIPYHAHFMALNSQTFHEIKYFVHDSFPQMVVFGAVFRHPLRNRNCPAYGTTLRGAGECSDNPNKLTVQKELRGTSST